MQTQLVPIVQAPSNVHATADILEMARPAQVSQEFAYVHRVQQIMHVTSCKPSK